MERQQQPFVFGVHLNAGPSPAETPCPTRVRGIVFCSTCGFFFFYHNPFILMLNTFFQLDVQGRHLFTLAFENNLSEGQPQACMWMCWNARPHVSAVLFSLPWFQEMWKSALHSRVTCKSNRQPCYRVTVSSWAYCNGKSKFVLKRSLLCSESILFLQDSLVACYSWCCTDGWQTSCGCLMSLVQIGLIVII